MFLYKEIEPNINILNKEAQEGWRLVAVTRSGGYLLERVVRVDKEEKDLLTPEFLKAWDYYGKLGNRHKSSLKWAKLTKTEKDIIRVHLPKYISGTEIAGKGDGSKTYRKHFETYLSQKHWENDVTMTEHTMKNIIKKKSEDDPSYINSVEYFEDLKKLEK